MTIAASPTLLPGSRMLPARRAPEWSDTRRIDAGADATRSEIAVVKDAYDPVPRLKRQLGQAILEQLHNFDQLGAARRLGVDQARMSNLQHHRFESFSLQQLVRLAARVSGEVTINVAWASRAIWIIPWRPPRRRPGS